MQKRIEKEPAIWETGPAVMEPPKKARKTGGGKRNAPTVVTVHVGTELQEPKSVIPPVPPPPVVQPAKPCYVFELPGRIETAEQLQAVLDQDPPEEWLKILPEAHGPQQADGSYQPYYYLPINRQKQLMQAIFGGYRREILHTTALKNSIVVTMRVAYRNPVTDLEEWQDGIGASSAAASLVQMAAPGAGSMAFMDAVKNIGRIFGRDLNKEGGEPVEANFTLNA